MRLIDSDFLFQVFRWSSGSVQWLQSIYHPVKQNILTMQRLSIIVEISKNKIIKKRKQNQEQL